MVARLSGVILFVHDIARSLEFYQALGLTFEREGDLMPIWSTPPPVQFALAPSIGTMAPMIHLSFEVAELPRIPSGSDLAKRVIESSVTKTSMAIVDPDSNVCLVKLKAHGEG